MGAAEWIGYSSTTPYSTYSSLQSTPSSYGYETTNIGDHHSNFHIPTGNKILIISIVFLSIYIGTSK